MDMEKWGESGPQGWSFDWKDTKRQSLSTTNIPSFFQMAVDELLLPNLTVLAGVMKSVVESAISGAT